RFDLIEGVLRAGGPNAPLIPTMCALRRLANQRKKWQSENMTGQAGEEDVERCVERTFYRRLLELGKEAEVAPLLDNALALAVEYTGARLGYLELHHDDVRGTGFWRAYGCTAADLAAIRASVSRGIIQAALAVGETVETPSAKDDPRFAARVSVQSN